MTTFMVELRNPYPTLLIEGSSCFGGQFNTRSWRTD